MSTIFSNNLKKFRQQKNLTQEQVAELLEVSTQTISRWECNTTLPEVTILPKIARLYCVTVDDFFKENSSAYDNYAQRLACVYEKTKTPEDFIRADLEFKKLMKTNEYSSEDMRMHGLINMYMMWSCRKKSLELFDKVITREKISQSRTYWLTKYAKANFSILIGKSDEYITEQLKTVEENPDNAEEMCVLIRTFYYAKRYEEGYAIFLKAKEKFNNFSNLYYVGGDICWKIKKYAEAFQYWDKSIQLDDATFPGAKYSKAFCYEEICEYENAYNIWLEIIETLKTDGYELEIEAAEKRAQACLEKMNR